MAEPTRPNRRTTNAGPRPPRGERAPKTDTPPTAQSEPAADTSHDYLLGETPTKRYTPDERKLIEALRDTYFMFSGLAIGIGMRRQDAGLTGAGIKTAEMAQPLAEGWIDLSRRNPAVKAMLKRFTEVSAAGVLMGMHLACLAPLLVDRGILPPEMAGFAANGTPT